MTPFVIHKASGTIPIIVSVPHCGTMFPIDIRDQFSPNLISSPDDTDWFVEKLYSFAPAMGITMIHAVYNRWVIDLNRDPQSKPLYSDGRIITGLCPTTNFLGEPLYLDKRGAVSQGEIQSRLANYYIPYHEALSNLLKETKNKFGKVLLWDCHSIRHVVRTIQASKFPDLNLGDNDERSADKELVSTARECLSSTSFSFSYNHPFKGGYITRHFGNPDREEHALQLEMNKYNYMDDDELNYHPVRARRMQELLKRTFDQLAEVLTNNA
jgi:N-formylglutamate deformylase